MSESTLSIGWVELQQEVGHFLGFGRTIASWETAEAGRLAQVANIVQSGVRRVYYPVGADPGYEWSWLRPAATLAITVAGGYDYDLPDNFGRLIGDFNYAPEEYKSSIAVIAEGSLNEFRAMSNLTGPPTYVAIRPKSMTVTASTGQRQEAIFWPTPDASYTLHYNYEAYSGVLTDALPYPLGGMELAELYIESCLAVAEQRMNDEVGLHMQVYQALLADAIARDRKRGARVFGFMGHQEKAYEQIRHGDTGGTYPLYYKGVLI